MEEQTEAASPLLFEFFAFADRQGSGQLARLWARDPNNLAAGRVAEAVMTSTSRRNAFRGLLKEVRKWPRA